MATPRKTAQKAAPVPDTQAKALITVGYKKFIMPVELAGKLMELFTHAEHYETEGYGETKTYHLGTLESEDYPTMEIIPYETYAVAKMAGPRFKGSE